MRYPRLESARQENKEKKIILNLFFRVFLEVTTKENIFHAFMEYKFIMYEISTIF